MPETAESVVAKYPVQLIPDPDVGGYTVVVPDLPGCISEGDTEEEALTNIQEAIELYVEYLIDQGRPVPPPSRATHLVSAPECVASLAAD